MTTRAIRVKAVCVIRRGAEMLVASGWDSVKGEAFFGPLGGGVEFGEPAAQAIRREFREELGAELEGVELLGVVESRFTYEGSPGHEIVFVFQGRLCDPALYERAEIPVSESNGERFIARWVPLDRFGPGGPLLYPDGLLGMLPGPAPGD